eukprot:49568-Prorocentrum_minimum.AAC.1
MSGWSPTDRVLLMSRCHLAGLRGATRGAQDEPDLLVPHQAALPAAARAEVWSSEDADMASAPTTDRESKCTVRTGGTSVCRTIAGYQRRRCSRFQEARLRVEYRRVGLVPRTYLYWARLLHRCTVRPTTVDTIFRLTAVKHVIRLLMWSPCQVDETRPMNELRISGQFSLAELHSWVVFCLPDIPARPPADEVSYCFESVLMGTVLIAKCVYALSPRPIGPHCWHMPSPLVRLVHTAGICPLPSFDWSTLRAYALSPRPIGSRCGYMPSPRHDKQSINT